MPRERRVCFVSGTRAEFGLMASALQAIAGQPGLRLQIAVTGMHLDRSRGSTLALIHADGWKVDAVVPWGAAAATPTAAAAATGRAMAGLAETFDRLATDIVLLAGDRVEAFAAAAAGHVGGRIVAHVHGGDRALGQVDDSLRHAITKLAHVHFPATLRSAGRILKMGEDASRIFRVGSPGLDGIRSAAAPWSDVRPSFPGLPRGRYALVLLHPASADDEAEYRTAVRALQAVERAGFEGIAIIYPNNDPGSGGIVGAWESLEPAVNRHVCRNVPRATFLGLLRDAAVLAGNSSSGIIEAASFGTPVVDIGPRQYGREHSGNLVHVDSPGCDLQRQMARLWNAGRPARSRAANVYDGRGAGGRIATALARINLPLLRRKIISF